MLLTTSDLFELHHPFWKWEEVNFNMWGNVKDKSDWLQRAIAFTGDHMLYGSWMFKVADAWKYSCEHHLTKMETNRKPWIGHAAVAMAIQCPEDIVREAWGHLTQTQQDAANEQARLAIEYWERTYA
jgi:hypothetical protein